MAFYLVEHEWERKKSQEVQSVVGGIIEKERKRQLPEGHQLIGIMLSASEPKALCLWQSKSKEELEQLLQSINLPTKYSIMEYQILFGVSKVF